MASKPENDVDDVSSTDDSETDDSELGDDDASPRGRRRDAPLPIEEQVKRYKLQKAGGWEPRTFKEAYDVIRALVLRSELLGEQ
jgi:hypothetical protein